MKYCLSIPNNEIEACQERHLWNNNRTTPPQFPAGTEFVIPNSKTTYGLTFSLQHSFNTSIIEII